jgi:hypothetical protein
MTNTNEKILIGIDNEIVELSGKEKEQFIALRQADNDLIAQQKLELEAKIKANKLAADKLLALGLTQDDLKALGLEFKLEDEKELLNKPA